MRQRRSDTLFSIVRQSEVSVPELPDVDLRVLVARMRQTVKDALQTAHLTLLEASEGMEFDLNLVRSRLERDGLRANMRAFRTGDLYRRSTQFDLLQRLDAVFDLLMKGEEPEAGVVMVEDED